MVATTQIEAKLAFEPNTASGDLSSGGAGGAARESNKPDFIRNSANDSGAAPASSGDEAVRVELSPEARQIATSENGDAARDRPVQSTTSTDPLQAKIDSDATTVLGGVVDPTSDVADVSNQVASTENEQAGNDTSNRTEAGRTLGQVIDTFA